MDSRTIIKRLKVEGWYLVASVGSHYHFKHPTLKGKVIVPPPRKNFPKETLNNLYKQTGWK